MKPVTISRNDMQLGRNDLVQAADEYSVTEVAYVDVMLGLDRLLAFMPMRRPQGALDTHLLLYPLNVLRLTETILQVVMSLPDGIDSTKLELSQAWSGLFAVPCTLIKTPQGDCRVRVAWQIRATEEQSGILLNRRHLIKQWENVLRKLQHGQSCPLLGLRRATGVGIRLSASQAVNALVQALPDLLDDMADHKQGRGADAVLDFCGRIRAVLKDAACAPLYEELSEFYLSAVDVDLVFAVENGVIE